MADAPICEYFGDEPLLTPAKLHALPKLPAGVKTAVATFLCDHADTALAPVLAESKLLFSVYGRSGKVPVYLYRDQCLLVLLAVGSPVAVGVVEELAALGIENLLVFGTAGWLDEGLATESLFVIDQAIRDEGASYHYLPASTYVATDTQLSDWLVRVLQTTGNAVARGISWTTDGFYRETRGRLAKRVSQGARVVEMECAGFAAACQRLGVRLAEFVFASDVLGANDWHWCGDAVTQDERRSRKVAYLNLLLAKVGEIKLPKIK